MQTIRDLKRRVTTAYPQWYEWTMLQRQLLMLRESHGEFTIETDYFSSPLNELTKIVNQDIMYIVESIKRCPTLVKALKDYREQKAYRFGKTKKGKKMKRRCTQQDLLQLIAYDHMPAAITAVATGAKPRFSDTEKHFLQQWIDELDKKPKGRNNDGYYEDEIRPFNRDVNPEEVDVNIFNLPDSVRKPDYSDDGLPDFSYSGDNQETQPETQDVEEEENLFD